MSHRSEVKEEVLTEPSARNLFYLSHFGFPHLSFFLRFPHLIGNHRWGGGETAPTAVFKTELGDEANAPLLAIFIYYSIGGFCDMILCFTVIRDENQYHG